MKGGPARHAGGQAKQGQDHGEPVSAASGFAGVLGSRGSWFAGVLDTGEQLGQVRCAQDCRVDSRGRDGRRCHCCAPGLVGAVVAGGSLRMGAEEVPDQVEGSGDEDDGGGPG